MCARRVKSHPTSRPIKGFANAPPRLAAIPDRKFIDAKLARGLAHSIATFKAPGQIKSMRRAFETRVFPRWYRMTSIREARRFLQQVAVPAVAPFALNTAVFSTVDGPTLLAEYCEITDAKSLVFCWVWYAPLAGDGVDIIEQSVMFRERAIARCMQREGTDSLQDVFGLIQSAAAHWLQVFGVASEGGWKQAFLWCDRGIFIGEMREATLQISTYISADQPSAQSRWIRLHQFLRATCDPLYEAIALSPADGVNDQEITAGYLKRLDGILQDAVKRFPFLLDVYQPREDRHAKAWAVSPALDPP